MKGNGLSTDGLGVSGTERTECDKGKLQNEWRGLAKKSV
jgi:hypothetical protein